MSDITKAERMMEEKDSESEALAALEAEIKAIRKSRRADWFYFIFVQLLIVDAILFIYLVDGGAAIALVLMQIVFLLLIADRFDITYVEIIFARFAKLWDKTNGDNS
jgi:hypothetical protein